MRGMGPFPFFQVSGLNSEMWVCKEWKWSKSPSLAALENEPSKDSTRLREHCLSWVGWFSDLKDTLWCHGQEHQYHIQEIAVEMHFNKVDNSRTVELVPKLSFKTSDSSMIEAVILP